MDVDGLPVLDLRDPDTLAALGLDREALVGARAAPQRLADRARGLGAQGLVAPSAADPDGWSLVVFPAGFDTVRSVGSRLVRPRPPHDAVVGRGRGT